jgi:hypothetical protein
MPPSTVSAPSPIEAWANRVISAVEALRHAPSVLSDLRNIPAADASERLAVLAAAFQVLGLPSPSLCFDQTDALKAHARALMPPEGGLWPEFVSLAAAIDGSITQALRAGARDQSVVAASDFAPGGLLFVQLPPSPFQFIRGVSGHASGVSGLGEEHPISVRGLASALPRGHHLLEALPPSALVPTASGPAYVLGVGVMATAEAPRVPHWFFVRDVIELTVQAREHLRREQEEKATREAWEAAQRRNDAALRKTPEQLKVEEELAAVKQQLAELKNKGGAAA